MLRMRPFGDEDVAVWRAVWHRGGQYGTMEDNVALWRTICFRGGQFGGCGRRFSVEEENLAQYRSLCRCRGQFRVLRVESEGQFNTRNDNL